MGSGKIQTLPTNDQDLFKLSCHKMDAFRALLEQEPWLAEKSRSHVSDTSLDENYGFCTLKPQRTAHDVIQDDVSFKDIFAP